MLKSSTKPFKSSAFRYFILSFLLQLAAPIHAETVSNKVPVQNNQNREIDANSAEIAKQSMAFHSEVLQKLMLTLYQHNPKQLKKSTQVSAEEMVQWTFEGPFGWKFDGVRRLQGLDALSLAVDADFSGDRVLALITGLHTLLTKSYGGKNEYDFSGEINPQYLYNTARNIEIASVKISELNKLAQALVLLDGNKPADLTQQLSALISRVDADANRFAEQKQQTIQLLNKHLAEPIVWQAQ